jgi:serpin B
MKKMVNVRNTALCSVLAASMLVGCAGIGNINTVSSKSAEKEQPSEQKKAENDSNSENKKEQVSVIDVEYSGDFNKSLVSYVEKNGFSEENYMVSPTSLRAALALAVAGADTDTKEELIHAMGFENVDEVNAWYTSVTQMITDFDAYIEEDQKFFESQKQWMSDDAKGPEGKLVMLNSIWNNTDLNGKFGKDFVKYVKKNYSSEAYEVGAKDFTEKANKWVSDGTNGLIPSISSDMSNVNAALINTLYLKSSWVNTFEEYATKSDTFTTVKGEQVQKEFMNQQDRFSFYEDEKGKLIVLPLNGRINAVFVLGEIDDIHDAMNKAAYEDVIVKLPKFEVESAFVENELIDFLQKRGAGLAFTDNADFSVMCPDAFWMITDIIQKTKIKIDEDGIEAAAATAIMMCESALMVEDKPKEFIADKPFKFYICGGENNAEMLFCGQVVK